MTKAEQNMAVEQCDRDAAMSLRMKVEHITKLDEIKYINGEYDNSAEVQAFARHRLATSDVAYRRMREALQPFADAALRANPNHKTAFVHVTDLNRAAAALSPAGDAPAVGDENMTVAEAIEASKDRDPLIQHLSFAAVAVEKSFPSASKIIRRAIDALASPSPAALATSDPRGLEEASRRLKAMADALKVTSDDPLSRAEWVGVHSAYEAVYGLAQKAEVLCAAFALAAKEVG